MSWDSLWARTSLPWPLARLKDHVDLTNGFPFDSAGFNPSVGTPVVRIRDLLTGATETYFEGRVPPEVMVGQGDLLVGMDGDFNAVTWTGGPAALNQRLCLIRARPSMEQRYLAYVIPLPLKAMNDVTFWTTVKHLSSQDLLAERIPLPPLATQRAIADYLDHETARIDALIEKKQELLRLLVERRMTVMADGVSGRFTSNGILRSTLPWLPWRGASWREAKLTLVARLGSGHTPSRDHPEWWEECNVPWITTGEVAQLRSDRVEFLFETREKISELGVANSSAEVHPKGTVVLCRTASAGYSGIMGTAMATSQDFATWICGPLIRPRFLLLCLRAMRQDLLGRLAMGSTHKTIYMPDMEALRVPLPEVDEQDAIVDAVWLRLRAIDSVIDAIHTQVDLLTEHRQSLITAAVTGELDVAGMAA